MATEKNEETDGNQISSISSIFSEMETMMGDFRDRLPDFIEKTRFSCIQRKNKKYTIKIPPW